MFCSLEVLNKGKYKHTCKNTTFKDNNHCVNILASHTFSRTMHMIIIVIVSTRKLSISFSKKVDDFSTMKVKINYSYS